MPLLDHRFIEYAWRLLRAQLGRGRDSNRIVRRILHCHVPAQLLERSKMFFGIPFGEWTRGSLADWAQDLLPKTSLNAACIFDVAVILKQFQ